MSTAKVEVENITAHPVTLRDGLTGDECSVRAFESTSVEARFLVRPHNLIVNNTGAEVIVITPDPDENSGPSTPVLNAGSKQSGGNVNSSVKTGAPNSQ